LDGIAKLITLLGSLAGMTIISLLVSALLATRRRTREAVFLYLNFFLTNFLMSYLKMQIGRNRPVGALVEVTGYSFPSGHAMVSMAFYGFMVCWFPGTPAGEGSRAKGYFY
jgi:undecaprenyl-diphosphatase